MDDDVAIKVEHVSKKYCKSLRRSMLYGVKDIGRNMLGMSSHSENLRKDEFWALDDVSFEVKKGETLGIIGPNGSGKTTSLKLLNGIFWPDKGKTSIKGRVGALIEVGAGFHPLLTGRENVYLNGAILGMTKREMDERFDSIVEFADIGDFVDNPVKYYSSGMFVRLGFAIAVHCEPDVLLVDEVLAVGDTSFRHKCYQRMNEIKRRNDVTTVIISHDLFTIEKFCDKGIFLNNGVVKRRGGIQEVIGDYQELIAQLSHNNRMTGDVVPQISCSTKEAIITDVEFLGQNGEAQEEFTFGNTFGIRVEYKTDDPIDNPQIIEVAIHNHDGVRVCVLDTMVDDVQIHPPIQGIGVVECWIESLPLLANRYYVDVCLYDSSHMKLLDYWSGTIKSDLSFVVLPNRISSIMADWRGICHFDVRWVTNGREIAE